MRMPKLTISPSKLQSAPKPVCCHPLHALRGLVLLNHQASSVMTYVWTCRATKRIGGTPGETESRAHYTDCVRGGWEHTPRNF